MSCDPQRCQAGYTVQHAHRLPAWRDLLRRHRLSLCHTLIGVGCSSTCSGMMAADTQRSETFVQLALYSTVWATRVLNPEDAG